MNSAQLDDFTSHKEFGAPKEYNPVSKFIYSIIKFAQSYEKESNAISKLLPEVPTEVQPFLGGLYCRSAVLQCCCKNLLGFCAERSVAVESFWRCWHRSLSTI